MAREIERKFLLTHDGWRGLVTHSVDMRQGYMSSAPEVSVRVRIAGPDAFLNFKGATLGVARHEFEYPIPLEDAAEMLELFCGERVLTKTRHHVPFAGEVWEIDEFHGANAGLIVAELELEREDSVFERPDWIGEEVSDDPRYYNVCLVEQPWSRWR
jgi:adenylate cyclase